MTVFQIAADIMFRAFLTVAVLGLFPASLAVAQTPNDIPLPDSPNRTAVESYSLPPGPGNGADKSDVVGPVDAEVPLARPITGPPRNAPAKASLRLPLPTSARPAARPTAAETTADRVQAPVNQAQSRSESKETTSAPDPGPPATEAVTALDENQEITATTADREISPAETPTEPVTQNPSNDGILFSFAALLIVLLGVLFFWRVRKAPPKQAMSTASDRAKSGLTGKIAKLSVPPRPAPAITIDFQPRSANATLFNAVLGFELTLSNDGSEDLVDVRISGSMVQAEGHGPREPMPDALSPLHELETLRTGGAETISSEFRVPLASIRPIQFGSQALFVPLVQISIEFTDGSGFQHIQIAVFLIGQEHQPPRPKMAPFRLDMGPRSFNPLGYRLLSTA
jgi:hypothetical protein